MMRTAISLTKQENVSDFADKSFFKVKEVPAYAYLPSNTSFDARDNFKIIPDKKVILREDDGSYISTVGKNYSTIDNQTYFNSIVDNLKEGGVDYNIKSSYVEGNGKRTTMIVSLPQFKMFKGSEEEQDFELRIRNSLDTTLAADSVLGFLKLVCTNGMKAFEADMSFRMTHKGDIAAKTKDVVELYRDFDNVYTKNKNIITRLGETNGSRDKIAAYIGNGEITAQPLFTGERWAKKIQTEWQQVNQAVNLWALYNMFTEIISHRYGSNYSSKANKMAQLNREVSTWSKILM